MVSAPRQGLGRGGPLGRGLGQPLGKERGSPRAGAKAGAAGGEVGQAGAGAAPRSLSMEAGAAWGATGKGSPGPLPSPPAFPLPASDGPPPSRVSVAGLAHRRRKTEGKQRAREGKAPDPCTCLSPLGIEMGWEVLALTPRGAAIGRRDCWPGLGEPHAVVAQSVRWGVHGGEEVSTALRGAGLPQAPLWLHPRGLPGTPEHSPSPRGV